MRLRTGEADGTRLVRGGRPGDVVVAVVFAVVFVVVVVVVVVVVIVVFVVALVVCSSGAKGGAAAAATGGGAARSGPWGQLEPSGLVWCELPGEGEGVGERSMFDKLPSATFSSVFAFPCKFLSAAVRLEGEGLAARELRRDSRRDAASKKKSPSKRDSMRRISSASSSDKSGPCRASTWDSLLACRIGAAAASAASMLARRLAIKVTASSSSGSSQVRAESYKLYGNRLYNIPYTHTHTSLV